MVAIRETPTLTAYAQRQILTINPSGNVNDPLFPLHGICDGGGSQTGIVGNPLVVADATLETAVAATNTALGTDGSSPPTLPGGSTGVRGWLRYIGSLLSGTLTVSQTLGGNPLSSSNRLPVEIDANNVTLPVSAASLPLPSGAATAAGQAATQPRSIASNAPRVSATGNLANLDDAVTVAVDGMNTVVVQLASGGWSGTAVFEASADGGTTWTAVNLVPYAGGAGTGSATAGGLWEMAVGGLTHMRVRASGAITSGPVAAVVAATNGLKSIRVGNPSSNPLTVVDGANAAFSNFAALTADDTTGHNVAAGRTVEVNCTTAGNISLKLANGGSKILPVQVGFQTFPWAAVGLNATGTTATASVVNWY